MMQGPTPPRSRRQPKPKTLLRLIGPAAPAIQAIAATSPTVARQLVSWRTSYVHALAIFLQSIEAVDPHVAKQLFMSDHALQKATAVDLLHRAGIAQPSRFLPLLDRLAGSLHTLEQYRQWESLLANRTMAGHISSCTRLSSRKLEALAQLPLELCSQQILKATSSRSDAAALVMIVDAVCRACPDVPIEDVQRSLRGTNAKVEDWLKQWLCKAELPEPPFPGNELLVPLRTGAAIRRTALGFRNCLMHYLDEAIAGKIFFYIWSGEQPALIAIRPLGQIGWILDGIKCPENKKPAAATKNLIVRQFAEWGCCTDDNIQHSLRKWGAWGLL